MQKGLRIRIKTLLTGWDAYGWKNGMYINDLQTYFDDQLESLFGEAPSINDILDIAAQFTEEDLSAFAGIDWNCLSKPANIIGEDHIPKQSQAEYYHKVNKLLSIDYRS